MADFLLSPREARDLAAVARTLKDERVRERKSADETAVALARMQSHFEALAEATEDRSGS